MRSFSSSHTLRDTRHKLDQLHDEDAAARETFRAEQGDFLPSDIEKPVVQRVQIREFVKARINAVVFFKPHPREVMS
jgi:hypothetical protein